MVFVCGETQPFPVNHSRVLPLEAVCDKAIANAAMAFDLVERRTGLEPATGSLEGCCSTN